MARVPPLALLAAAALAGCAGARPRAERLLDDDLPARLATRAASLLGEAGPFRVDGVRYQGDCIGFVEAVYEAEGIPLRRLMQRTAPRQSSGVVAAYEVVLADGEVFGGGGRWPRPGDLVFFHDTYDRNRNGRADDGFTHVGIVEAVDGGRVTFLHRGGDAVVRAALDLDAPDVARDSAGTVLNSPLRAKRSGPVHGLAGLAGQLFAGFGHLDPAAVAAELASSASVRP